MRSTEGNTISAFSRKLHGIVTKNDHGKGNGIVTDLTRHQLGLSRYLERDSTERAHHNHTVRRNIAPIFNLEVYTLQTSCGSLLPCFDRTHYDIEISHRHGSWRCLLRSKEG